MHKRIFIDTSFVHAVLSARDKHHRVAMGLLPRLHSALEVVITEVVLIEIADSLCRSDRKGATAWIELCQTTPNVRVVSLADSPFEAAVSLYRNRSDKTWSLTDCLSFEVMRERGLTEALTADRHFSQAGFRALLLDESKDDDNTGA